MIDSLVSALQASRGLTSKRDIAYVLDRLLATHCSLPDGSVVRIGDDCAALPDGDNWLLFAIEGFQNEFVQRDPYFAGYCGVMVNVSDIYAMGGRPIAVVDAIWSRDHEHASALLDGLRTGAAIYGTPVVGGHSNMHSDREQLSVAILGRAHRLMTSFDARPGDFLLTAIDLRGRYREPFSHWDASTGIDAARLRADLEILPALAAEGLCAAAKDISQAGIIGTTLMLLECSGVGGMIDIDAIPAPSGVDAQRWLLSTFPSYGFILSVPEHTLAKVRGRFQARGIACSEIGQCDDSAIVRLRAGTQERAIWRFDQQTLMGCWPGPRPARENRGA